MNYLHVRAMFRLTDKHAANYKRTVVTRFPHKHLTGRLVNHRCNEPASLPVLHNKSQHNAAAVKGVSNARPVIDGYCFYININIQIQL